VNLTLEVFGRPAPQGSKRYIGGSAKQGGRFIEASKYLPAWRKAVTQEAITVIAEERWEKVQGPVELEVTFFLERPATVKRSARPYPVKPPDIDKMVRAIGDSLTDAGVWEDDSQVVRVIASKFYDDEHRPGAVIKITPIF
jgi:Holliday junction resolvase RusA-like endonuclease